MDGLDLAVQATNDDASREAILEGIRGIATSFQNALTNAGVEPVPAIGEVFNPALHEAVDTVDTDPELDGQVVGEYTRGFRIGERLLRPARVQVGRGVEEQAKIAND